MAGKIKLLVVDDEERFLNTLSQRLEMRGFDVSMAVNGQEALEAAGREEFELALLDLKMPGLNGEQVLQLLKEKHVAMEINTSGFTLRNEPYPGRQIIRRAIELGIPLVAGSDAHRPSQVGRDFERIPELLDAVMASSPPRCGG